VCPSLQEESQGKVLKHDVDFPLEPIAMVAFLTLLEITQLSYQLDNTAKILGRLDGNCKFDVYLATAAKLALHLSTRPMAASLSFSVPVCSVS
jgi:hypothetical protein